MMKIRQIGGAILMGLFAFALNAQDAPVDTTIILDPSMFIPADTGYFRAGVWKDLNGDGVDEYYSGCFDAYGDDDHREASTQNGWDYKDVIIFRSCDTSPSATDDVIKGTVPTEDWPAEGNIIQTAKSKYLFTDSASYGYIISPEFSNITSLNVKVGSDLSINNNRSIHMLVEASYDGGETFEYMDNPSGVSYFVQDLTNQGGDNLTYSESSNAGFAEIVKQSKTKNVRLRFLSVPPQNSDKNGERLKFWWIEIKGQTAISSGTGGVLSTSPDVKDIIVNNLNIQSLSNKTISVYTMAGKQIGTGSKVEVPGKGLYIVRAIDGTTAKILIK